MGSPFPTVLWVWIGLGLGNVSHSPYKFLAKYLIYLLFGFAATHNWQLQMNCAALRRLLFKLQSLESPAVEFSHYNCCLLINGN